MATKGYKRVKVDFSNLEIDLSAVPRSKVVRQQINEVFAERCDKYVPYQTGRLADVSITPYTITYRAPYAHYQYTGIVYGPNYRIPVKETYYEDPFTGEIVDNTGGYVYRTPRGTVKFRTNRELNYSHIIHPLATSKWDEEMLRNEGDNFIKDCSDIIYRYLRKHGRK